ncbi:MAG: hypothetical protein ACK55Z_14495 [bacterium]
MLDDFQTCHYKCSEQRKDTSPKGRRAGRSRLRSHGLHTPSGEKRAAETLDMSTHSQPVSACRRAFTGLSFSSAGDSAPFGS